MKTYSELEREFLKSKYRNEPYLRDAWIQNEIKNELFKEHTKHLELDKNVNEEKIVFKLPKLDKLYEED